MGNRVMRGCREEWVSIRIENIIRDDKKSRKRLAVNYHRKMGGGVKNLPVCLGGEVGFWVIKEETRAG